MKWLVIILSLFLILGCSKEKLNGYQTFTIKEGDHSSGLKFKSLKEEVVSYEIKFDESAEYYLDPVNQLDVNKLFGFSDCNSHHQKNSARFGWRWMDDKVEILAYVYNDEVIVIEHIGYVGINETHTYRLELTDNSYIFQLDNTTIIMDRKANCQVGYYYKLWPYFGGDQTAPHDIKIIFREI